jgi:hypothetical protein
MRWVHAVLAVILGLTLAAIIIRSEKKQQSSAHELLELKVANGVLRKTLGEMTVEMTKKDKQIDELNHLTCREPALTKPHPPLRPVKPVISARIGAD